METTWPCKRLSIEPNKFISDKVKGYVMLSSVTNAAVIVEQEARKYKEENSNNLNLTK